MFKLFYNFIEDIIQNVLDYIVNNILSNIVNIALYPENSMDGFSLSSISSTIMYFGISLIVLKFLRKGFDVYILWTDGDASAEPSTLVFNFMKAMALALSFTALYPAFVDVLKEIIDTVLGSIAFQEIDAEMILKELALRGFINAVLLLVSLVLYIALYIKSLKVGLELLILRVGFPFACSGVLDANDGVFASYVQKFAQVAFTLIIQVGLAKLSMTLIAGMNLIWAVVAIIAAFSVPNLLRDFMIPGGGGGMGNVYHGVQVFRMLKSVAGGVLKK